MGENPQMPQAKRLQPWLTQTTVWLLLSLAIALLYRLPALQSAFASDYVVQDDARQHVFWMQRFVDSTLFPNDLLADYFQSVAPWGYSTLYRFGVWFGLDPWTFNKILPVLIAIAATLFAFGAVLELVQIPVAAFVSTMFLNQIFPLRDDIVSATPAAFFYPLFLAFIYFNLKRWWLPCALSIIVLGLFYPQGVLIIGGMLVLQGLGQLQWRHGRPQLAGTVANHWVICSGLLAAGGVLLPYILQDSAYGPVLTLTQAREMYALSAEGWSKFFVEDPVDFWLFGKRSGLLPLEWSGIDLKVQPQIWLTLAIPFLIVFPGKSALARKATPRILILLQMTIASLVCFFLAHLFLFELHLPNRYTEHSLRLLVALGSGTAVALLMDRWRGHNGSRKRRYLAIGLLGLWAIAPLVVSILVGESYGNYHQGRFPELYEYLKSQPKDTVVASLDTEINNIPSFTHRSIFVGGEGYTLPYHLGYYEEVKRRSVDLMEAQYSFEAPVVVNFLEENPIDIWLVSEGMFVADWVQNISWFRQYAQETDAAQRATASPQATVVQQVAAICTQIEFPPYQLLDTDCIKQTLKEQNTS